MHTDDDTECGSQEAAWWILKVKLSEFIMFEFEGQGVMDRH